MKWLQHACLHIYTYSPFLIFTGGDPGNEARPRSFRSYTKWLHASGNSQKRQDKMFLQLSLPVYVSTHVCENEILCDNSSSNPICHLPHFQFTFPCFDIRTASLSLTKKTMIKHALSPTWCNVILCTELHFYWTCVQILNTHCINNYHTIWLASYIGTVPGEKECITNRQM